MAILIGVIIDLVLGLTGAGGSIFAVPLLILCLNLPINGAMGIALGAVAASAFIVTLSNSRTKSMLRVSAMALGDGGGFLIVPPLLPITRKPISNAIATSLLIIGFIGTLGFISFLIANPSLDWALLSQICLGGILGMLTGRLVVKRIAGLQLKRIFAVASTAVGAATLTNGLS